MNRKYDYDKLEFEYIQGDMSLRELADSAGMSSHSMIMEASVKRGWKQKREEFRSRASSKAVSLLADDEGRRIAKEVRVRDNAIDAIDEAITKMRSDMKQTVSRERNGVWREEPLVVIRPQDVAILIDRLQVLFGKPSSITEERNLGLSLSATGNDPEFLRALVEASRGRGPDPGSVVSSPLPRVERARSN
jgi:hypothetical protein